MLDRTVAKYRSQFGSAGLREIMTLGTSVVSERKEHFGFHDGISQPSIKGFGDRADAPDAISAGEFILGYKNAYDQFTKSPCVPADSVANRMLPASPDGSRDLGKNGTYIVFRQLVQDVQGFWKYMDEATRDGKAQPDETAMVRFASKIVGRWPSGAPLVLSPDADNSSLADVSTFEFRKSDDSGLKCPIASHVRRTNPRDSLDMKAPESVKVSNKHRILRRGRSYGPPLAASMRPMDCLNAAECADERGLYFIALNSDIGRQFEFVQNAWVNNPKFNGLHEERDPLIGNHSRPGDPKTTGTFCVAENGLRRRYSNLPEFVTTKGGAYFFMPGINCLKYFAEI
jgi:Dyp-type peroxidase family